MSGKRFTLNLMKKPSEIEMDGKMISKYDVVRLLNELNDENNILNKNEDDLKECTIENIKLQEENEKLRKDKEQLKERLRECGMRVDKLLGNCR